MGVAGRPLISIITVVHNGVRTLPRCLASVSEQAYPAAEHLVVDGGSTDGTVDVLRACDSVAWWVSEPDRGIYDAMNKGIAAAHGEWLLFLGADDALAGRDVLRRCAASLETGAAMAYGDVRYSTGRRYRSSFGPHLLLQNTVHHQGAFYSARVFEGWRYDPAFRVVGDYELNLRLYLSRERCVRIDAVVAECAEAGVSRTSLRAAFRETNVIRGRHVGRIANASLTLAFATEFVLYRIAWLRTRFSRRRDPAT